MSHSKKLRVLEEQTKVFRNQPAAAKRIEEPDSATLEYDSDLVLNKTALAKGEITPKSAIQLQRLVGNQATMRLINSNHAARPSSNLSSGMVRPVPVPSSTKTDDVTAGPMQSTSANVSRSSDTLVPQQKGVTNLLQRGFFSALKSFGSGVVRFLRGGVRGLRTLVSSVGAVVGALIGVVPGIIKAIFAKKGQGGNSFLQSVQFGAEIGAIVVDPSQWTWGDRETASNDAQEKYGATIEKPEGITTPWKQSELDGILDALKVYEVMLTKDRYKTQAAIEMAQKGKVPMRVTKFKKIGTQLSETGGSGATNAYTQNSIQGSEITVCGRNLLRTLGASIFDRGMQRGIAVHELCHSLLKHEVESYQRGVDTYYKTNKKKTTNYWTIKEKQSFEKNKSAGDKEYPVTAYGASNPEDDMCETARYWFQDAELKATLKTRHPGRYAAFERVVERNLKIAADTREMEREEQAQPAQPIGARPEAAEAAGDIKPPPQLTEMLVQLKKSKAEQNKKLDAIRLELTVATSQLADVKGDRKIRDANREIAAIKSRIEQVQEKVQIIQQAINDTAADKLTPALIEQIFTMDYEETQWTSVEKMAEAGTTAAGEFQRGKNDLVGLGESF